MSTPVKTAFRNFLLADTPVTDLVGTDIFPVSFPGAPQLPGIVFSTNGGPSRSNIPLRAVSIKTECYAATALAARTLHETMRTALLGDFSDQVVHHTALRAKGMLLIQEEQEGQELPVDASGPDKGTPVVLGFYTVHFIDT